MNEPQATSHPKRRRPVLSWWLWVLVGFALALVLIALIMPRFARAHPNPTPQTPQGECLSNLKQIGLASLMYAQDYDEVFVRMPEWDDALDPYIKNRDVFHCPEDRRRNVLSYGMNADVAGLPLATWESPPVESSQDRSGYETATTVMFFEGEGLEVVERHKGGANYAFVDGHAKWCKDPPEDSGLFAREEERR